MQILVKLIETTAMTFFRNLSDNKHHIHIMQHLVFMECFNFQAPLEVESKENINLVDVLVYNTVRKLEQL